MQKEGKMLTIEQFANKEFAEIFLHQYFDEPLKYQSGLLQMIIMQGHMKNEDANVMALHFFAPIYLLMTVCDREPEREQEALQMHYSIGGFRVYGHTVLVFRL